MLDIETELENGPRTSSKCYRTKAAGALMTALIAR